MRLRARFGGLATVTRVAVAPEVRYWWREAPVPPGPLITQVYGYLLCPLTGRVLVQDDEGVFPRRTPGEWDADLTATLVREALEECQVRVGETAYLGYREVHRPDRAPYAQVRMASVTSPDLSRPLTAAR